MKIQFTIYFFLLAMLALVSCGEEEIDVDSINEMEILDFLAVNNLTAQKTASGLYYVINEEGNGQHPNINSTVTVHYRGYYTNGQQFDSSYDRGEPNTNPQ